jgi:hypothetical protein
MTQPIALSDFGAACDGQTDDTNVLKIALKFAASQKRPLEISGTAAYSDVLDLNGAEIQGGALYALNTARCAIVMRGFYPAVRDLRLTGVKPTARTSLNETNRIVADGARVFTIERVVIDTCSGAGIMARGGAQSGKIAGCTISNTLADAIHLTDRCADIEVSGNRITNAGDDGIAVVSYANQGGPVRSIQARRNIIRDNLGGRCMTVVGGQDVLYEDNEMSGNPGSAGLYIAQEDYWGTLACSAVTARHNTIVNCGKAAIGHYAVMAFAESKGPNTDTILERNVIIQDDARGGVRVFGANTNARVEHNVIVASPPTQLALGVLFSRYVDGPAGVRPA